MVQPFQPDGRRPSRWPDFVLAALVIATAALLGVLFVSLRGDVNDATAEVRRAQAELASALGRVSMLEEAVVRLSQGGPRSVAQLERDLRQLEHATFGYGSPQLEFDRFRQLEDCIDDVVSALNRRSSFVPGC